MLPQIQPGRCTGAACLSTLNDRTRSFAPYEGQEVTLTAFARCNGCEAGIDEGFQEKLDRLVEEGTQVVHLGKCTDRKDTGPCPVIAQARRLFGGQGNPGSYTGLTDRKYATYKMPPSESP